MTTPRLRWWAGPVCVVAYVVVAAITGGRPLFDGFAPPAPYRWVVPPPEFVAGNQPPAPAERNVPLTAEGNEATNASTADAQIIVTLPTGAVPPHPPDTTILLRLVPLDPGGLAPLPAGLTAQSNAYQLTMTYQPSGTPVTEIKPGPVLAMTAARHSTKLLYSADGGAWEETPSRPFGATQGLTGSLRGPGFYLVAADIATTTTTQGPGGSGGAAGVGIGVVAVLAIAVAALTLRSRRKQQAAAAAAAAARARAKSKSKPKSKAPPRKKPRHP